MAKITESNLIKGVQIVEPQMHGDSRGIFIETYRREWFPLGREMLQGNRGDRQAGCVVGLHYHLHQQAQKFDQSIKRQLEKQAYQVIYLDEKNDRPCPYCLTFTCWNWICTGCEPESWDKVFHCKTKGDIFWKNIYLR